ncbi:MAG TPA: hypothetical protein VIQ03_11860 [Gammaproteobacteria bacterium]
MTIRKITALLSTLFITGIAYANCPSTLKTDDLKDCIIVEGSGNNYQDWKKSYDQLTEIPSHMEYESRYDLENEPVFSGTIPGMDITKVAPAAGKPSDKK